MVELTSYHMFGSGNFWDKSLSCSKILKWKFSKFSKNTNWVIYLKLPSQTTSINSITSITTSITSINPLNRPRKQRLVFLKPIIMVFIPLTSFCYLQHFLVDESKIILVHILCTRFCPLCDNLTPFCKTSIIATKKLGTSQCVLTHCKGSFDDQGLF